MTLTALRRAVRRAVANYMSSEGCSCCQLPEQHAADKKKLARLLDVPQYPDKSGYNFSQFGSKRKRWRW